eukprot:m.104949 g.104949  ORF g.104949 m.104949 type:complete len:357 (-) comp15771_c0_seq1:206-1276(-)
MTHPATFHVIEFLASFLSMVGSVIVILVYWLLPDRRAHPSAIILFIAICDLVLSLRFFVRATAWIADPDSGDKIKSLHLFDDDCVSSITWSIAAETASQAWNCVWCVNVMFDLHYPVRDSSRFMTLYHIWAWVCTISMTTFILVMDEYGGVQYGDYVYCGIPNSTFHTVSAASEFFFTIFCLIFALASLLYAWRRLGTLRDRDAIHLLHLHAAYVFVFLVLWLGQRVASMANTINIVHQIISLLWQAQAFFVCIIRLQEPDIFAQLLLALGCKSCVYHFRPHLKASGLREPLVSEDDMSMLLEMPQSAGDGSQPHSAWGVSHTLKAELEVTDSLGMPAKTHHTTAAGRRRTDAGDL